METFETRNAELFCGSCRKDFAELSSLKEHILHFHNGLAKVCDSSSMTPKEELDALRTALKATRRLVCLVPTCSKLFQSVAGYLSHRRTCGIPVELVMCEVCGRMVKPQYMVQHNRMAHPPVKEESMEVDEIPTPTPVFQPQQQQHLGPEPKTLRPRVNKPNFTEIPDSLLMGECSLDELEASTEVAAAPQATQPDLQLLQAWEGCYQKPVGDLKPVTREMMAAWQWELDSCGKITCKAQGCGKTYTTRYGMKYHAARCNVGSRRWKCLLCGMGFVRGPKILWQHLAQNHTLSEAKELLEATKNHGEVPTKPDKGYYPPPYGIGTVNPKNNDPRFLKPLIQTMKWTLDFHKKHDCKEVFPEWKPNPSQWEELDRRSYEPYLPPLRESVRFKLVSEPEESVSDQQAWQQLGLFEALPGRGTWFVGGPVWASAWCPVPLGILTKQFVALSTCAEAPDRRHSLVAAGRERGLVQLWDLGVLGTELGPSGPPAPHLALALAHAHGKVWDMAWCPSGAWEDPSSYFYSSLAEDADPSLPRLGLLAVAFGDGYVRIYSVPHPEVVQRGGEDGGEPVTVYAAQAVATLAPPCPGPSMASWRSICNKISWQRTDGHRLIAASYGSGLVCIWDLSLRSRLVVLPAPSRVLLLRPYLTFVAHQSSATAVTWAPLPGGRFLATAGIDRTIKIWDLHNIGQPLNVVKKGLMTDIGWMPHWCGTFGAMDDCYNIFSTLSFYKECGYYNYTSRVVSPHNACTWSMSLSDWLNSEVSSDSSGEVVATVLCQLLRSVNNIKQMNHRRVPVYRLEMMRLDMAAPLARSIKLEPCAEDDEEESELMSKPPTQSAVDDPCLHHLPVKMYQDAAEHYGLVIHDYPVHDLTRIPEEEFKRLAKVETMTPSHPFQYQLSSVNSVCWNPNLGSHLWVFSVGQAGFARICHMGGLHQPEAEQVVASAFGCHFS